MRRTGRDGFTLIEALVAFAIVAAATLVVQRSLVQSRAALSLAAARAAPDWVARSLLAEPLSERDMSEGGRVGLEGGRRFAIRLAPLTGLDDGRMPETPEQARDRAASPVRWLPLRVSIAVETDRPAWLTVETIKLGRVVVATPAAGAARE